MSRSLLLYDEPSDAYSPGIEERLGLRNLDHDDYDYEPQRRRKRSPSAVPPSRPTTSFLTTAWLAVGSRFFFSYTQPSKPLTYSNEKQPWLSEKSDSELKSAMRRSPNRGKLHVAFAEQERWTESKEYWERKHQQGTVQDDDT